MQRYTVAVLVKNRFGVLNRVTSMFRRRQFNIDNLTLSETESPELSRITVQFDGEETNKQQLINQLYKLPDVVSISELNRDESVTVELMLIKMSNSPEIREELLAAAQAFDARTVDYSKDTIIFQMAADPRRIDAFVNLMKDYGIMEICRTGIVSLERGGSTIRKVTNY